MRSNVTDRVAWSVGLPIGRSRPTDRQEQQQQQQQLDNRRHHISPPGESLWLYIISHAPYRPFWTNVTSCTKPEIHNLLHCRRKKIAPRPMGRGNVYWKFREVWTSFSRYASGSHTDMDRETYKERHEKYPALQDYGTFVFYCLSNLPTFTKYSVCHSVL